MMSTDAKLKQASTLRSIAVNEGPAYHGNAKDDATALRYRATEDGRESRGVLSAECKVQNAKLRKRMPRRSAPIVLSQNLHSKGFGGGVPLNTETAAVKP